MRFKRTMLFLVLSFILCETSFLYENYEMLENIGNKFRVTIEYLDEYAKKIGLTEERLKTVAELRLRKEGITIIDEYSREIPVVYVRVQMVGTACNIDLKIHEWIGLPRFYPSWKWILVPIWSDSMLGSNIGNPETIVSSLNKLFDNFLNDYYKANPKEN